MGTDTETMPCDRRGRVRFLWLHNHHKFGERCKQILSRSSQKALALLTFWFCSGLPNYERRC